MSRARAIKGDLEVLVEAQRNAAEDGDLSSLEDNDEVENADKAVEAYEDENCTDSSEE